MIEVFLQYGKVPIGYPGNVYRPVTEKDQEACSQHKPNQICRHKIYGIEKERSFNQLSMYWALCKKVAENLCDQTKDDVDFEVKIQIAKKHPSLIKRFKSVNGIVYMEPISISYPNMKHLEACKYFDLAFPIMAGMIGVTVDKLLKNAKD